MFKNTNHRFVQTITHDGMAVDIWCRGRFYAAHARFRRDVYNDWKPEQGDFIHKSVDAALAHHGFPNTLQQQAALAKARAKGEVQAFVSSL